MKGILALAAIVIATACGPPPATRELNIAVASNFKQPAAKIVQEFQDRTGRNVIVTLGSTGKLYAQIEHGAPYDVFLAADAERPRLVEAHFSTAKGSRFTYAVGNLVLWSPTKGVVDPDGQILDQGGFSRIAIANPLLAPYGRAAEEVLKKRGLWRQLQDKLVRGENIGQTFQFVYSGNADIGFVALSQVKDSGGSMWIVPQELYSPIEQQAVLLSDDPGAREFLEYLKSKQAREIIRGYGYGLN